MQRREFMMGLGASMSVPELFAQSNSSIDDDRSHINHHVTSSSDLHEAFDALQLGDTIYISSENAPYHITEWLDIDVDSVSVFSDRSQAPPLIRAANGANCGGIRIGYNTHTRDVYLDRISFGGNYWRQTRGSRHHGFLVENARNIRANNCYVRHTHPHNEHGSGGSGFTVSNDANNVRINGFRTFNIGDRGIQIGGRNVTVTNTVTLNGFDRSIALDYSSGNGTHAGKNIHINSVRAINNSHGSIIGTGQPRSKRRSGLITIRGVRGWGNHRSLITLHRSNFNRFQISDCVGIGGGVDGIELGRGRSSSIGPAMVSGCTLVDYGHNGITIEGSPETAPYTIVGNTIENCSRKNHNRYNGIRLDHGGGVCGLNSVVGSYKQHVGGRKMDNYQTGLNYTG